MSSNWQTLNTSMSNAPIGRYIAVRPKGLHPARGTPFIPSIVSVIDGDIYDVMDELNPIDLGQYLSEDSQFYRGLEWCELPEGWQ